jgi:hypothetical protein
MTVLIWRISPFAAESGIITRGLGLLTVVLP